MSKESMQRVSPQRSAYLEAAMDLEAALLKAEALAEMACGEGGAVLWRMSDDQQDHYLWALAGFVRQAKAASEAMGQHVAPQRPAQGGANE
jgi:hypothetical protein